MSRGSLTATEVRSVASTNQIGSVRGSQRQQSEAAAGAPGRPRTSQSNAQSNPSDHSRSTTVVSVPLPRTGSILSGVSMLSGSVEGGGGAGSVKGEERRKVPKGSGLTLDILKPFIVAERPLTLPHIVDRRTYIPEDYPNYEPILWASAWLVWNSTVCPPRDKYPTDIPQLFKKKQHSFKLMTLGSSVECKRISNCLKHFNVNFPPNKILAWLTQGQTVPSRVPREVVTFSSWYAILNDRLAMDAMKSLLGMSVAVVKYDTVEEKVMDVERFSRELARHIADRAWGFWEGTKIFTEAISVGIDSVATSYIPMPWLPYRYNKKLFADSGVQMITQLHAGNCSLSNLDGIEVLINIEYLDVSNNRLYELPQSFGCSLQKLMMLFLSGNCLSNLPATTGRLSALTTLHLTSNHFSVLPDIFTTLTKLRDFDASHNPLQTLPSSLLMHRANITKWNVCMTFLNPVTTAAGQGEDPIGYIATEHYTKQVLRWRRALAVTRWVARLRILMANKRRDRDPKSVGPPPPPPVAGWLYVRSPAVATYRVFGALDPYT